MFLCDEPGQIDLSVEERKRRSRGWGRIGPTGNCVSGGVEVDRPVIWQNRMGRKKEKKRKASSSHSELLSTLSKRRGNTKGKFWPKVVWFIFPGEWMGNSVLIRHTVLLVIPALPLRPRQSRGLAARRIRVYLLFVCHVRKCSTAWNSGSFPTTESFPWNPKCILHTFSCL